MFYDLGLYTIGGYVTPCFQQASQVQVGSEFHKRGEVYCPHIFFHVREGNLGGGVTPTI